jgi:hypothetical protein
MFDTNKMRIKKSLLILTKKILHINHLQMDAHYCVMFSSKVKCITEKNSKLYSLCYTDLFGGSSLIHTVCLKKIMRL